MDLKPTLASSLQLRNKNKNDKNLPSVKDVWKSLENLRIEHSSKVQNLPKRSSLIQRRHTTTLDRKGFLIHHVATVCESESPRLADDVICDTDIKIINTSDGQQSPRRSSFDNFNSNDDGGECLDVMARDRNSKWLKEKMDQISMTRLHKIIKELRESEKSYVNSLKSGVKDFVVPFKSIPLPASLVGHCLDIFSNVEVILEFHETKFLPKLLDCGYDPEKVGNLFTTQIAMNNFDNYIFYMFNRGKSTKLCKENSHFFRQLQNNRIGINSFLLQPIQRLPRYQLMLRELTRELVKNANHLNETAIVKCCRAERNMHELINKVDEYCE